MLGFALRQQRSHGKRGASKKASTKRGDVWTITDTRQAADSSPKDDIVEEEDVSEAKSEENLEQEEDSSDNDDTANDQILLAASFTANKARASSSTARNLLHNDRYKL